MRKLLFSLLGIQLILFSCNSEETNESKTSKDSDQSNIEWKKVELDSAVREQLPVPEIETADISKTVNNNGELLAEFEIKTQLPKSDTLGMEIINMEVNEWLRSNFYLGEDDYKEKNLDDLIAKYEDFLKKESEAIGFTTNWVINANATVAYNKNGLMNYDLSVYSYTGGAHGNATTTLRTYDIVSGKRLGLEDMFEDTLALQKKMNEVFEKTMSDYIKENIDVDEVPLTKNIQLGSDTLIFYFNAYEIGPYAMGPVELKIAVKDIKDNLKLKLD